MFWHTRCLIVICILENISMIEGFKRRMSHKLTQKSFYIKSYRRTNEDYKYNDWENKTVDNIYDISITTYKEEIKSPDNADNKINEEAVTTPMTEMTTLAVAETTLAVVETTLAMPETTLAMPETTLAMPETTTVPPEAAQVSHDTAQNETSGSEAIITNVKQETGNQEINATNENIVSQHENSTYVTITEGPNVTNNSASELEDMLKAFVHTTPGVYTTIIPPPLTINVESLMPTREEISEAIVNPTTTPGNQVLDEIKEDINKTNEFFTSSLHELFLVLSRKNVSHIRMLLVAMNSKVESAIATESLAMFSRVVMDTFQASLQMLILAENDVVREYFNYALYAIENRHAFFKKDVNLLFDVLDTAYSAEDIANIIRVINKIKDFPNSTDSVALVDEAVEVFIYNPHDRIKDNPKERLLMLELHKVIQDRLYPGENLGRRYGMGWNRKLTTNRRSYKTMRNNQLKKPFKSEIHKNYNSIKFTKHTEAGKYRTNIKWIKVSKGHRKEKKGKESVKDLETSSSMDSSLQSLSSTSTSSESQDSDPVNPDSSYDEEDNVPSKRHRSDNKRQKEARTKQKSSIDLKFDRFDRFDKSTTQNEEDILKLNLKYALLHSGEDVKRRFGEFNKIRTDSFSDEEAILKSNIYRVFGFSHDLRVQFSTIPVYKTPIFDN